MPEDPATKSARKSPMPSGALGHDFRVLVAEDHQVNQQILAHFLSNLGLQFEIVPNGWLAVEAVKSRSFSAVLMDIQMPVMDGIAATLAIRALPAAQRDIPIIAVTAHSGPEQDEAYLAAGMNGVIAKPVVASTLLRALETHAAQPYGQA